MPGMFDFYSECLLIEWVLEDTVSRENSWDKAPMESVALEKYLAYLSLVTAIYEIEGKAMSTT